VPVSADDVRDVINVTSEEVPDDKILKMIKRAEVTLELETDKQVDSSNCTDAEKEAITVLSAVYAICYLTGGSAVGLSFSVGDQNVSVLECSPPLAVTGRRKAVGKKLTIQEINRDIIRISRVVIHPKYRTIGLRAKIVAETLPQAGKPYVETIAVMAKYNPFFEKAGMTKIAETTPNPNILKVVEKLRKFDFNPVFLTSEKANLNKLQNMKEKQVEGVITVIKEVTGIYRKRLTGARQAFLNKQEYGALVDAADTAKLAKMIRILGFLTQTKVYLFWKNK
jgi:N-acetylglutamate synthase-like GNAT family acetyltransferase